MPSNRFGWLARVKAVEREHSATRFATNFLLDAVRRDPRRWDDTSACEILMSLLNGSKELIRFGFSRNSKQVCAHSGLPRVTRIHHHARATCLIAWERDAESRTTESRTHMRCASIETPWFMNGMKTLTQYRSPKRGGICASSSVFCQSSGSPTTSALS